MDGSRKSECWGRVWRRPRRRRCEETAKARGRPVGGSTSVCGECEEAGQHEDGNLEFLSRMTTWRSLYVPIGLVPMTTADAEQRLKVSPETSA